MADCVAAASSSSSSGRAPLTLTPCLLLSPNPFRVFDPATKKGATRQPDTVELG